MDTTVADTLIGTTIDGRYRITGRVARGGMATVYTAVDDRLERTVALKIIHPSQATNVHFVDRFTDEAKTIARLTHPNVVAVYDQGRHLGLPYLVMEYVHGRTLRELLNQRRRLNPVEACAILEQMLAAIAAAHRAGLVHRDVKPENVLVAEAPSGGIANLVDAVVKVADFGLARAVEASTVDDSGQLMATVAYVAPELVTDGHADARTDVYSAGIVLFEMLTGQVPFDGNDPVQVAWQHVDHDVPAPSSVVPGLPRALDGVVERATRRDPSARPTDAGALLTDVQTVRDALGAANAQTALLRQVPATPSRHAAAETMLQAAIEPTRPAGLDTTAVVPAFNDRPTWARLPAQGANATSTEYGGRLSRSGARQARGTDRRRMLLISAVVVMLLVVVGSGWWVTEGRYTQTPALVNLTKAQAQLYAEQNHFKLFFGDGVYSDAAPKDSVVSQNPAATQRIVSGGTITINLSLGPEVFGVPDLTGQELSAAKSELEQANLVFKQGDGQYSDTVPEGVVVSTDPKVDTPLKRGNTVTVVVSKGRAPISLPTLTGRYINDVRSQLQQLGLTGLERYQDSDQPADTVIAQTPAAGTGMGKDEKVTLDISKGPVQVTVPNGQVTVPDGLVGQPCQQAQATLQGLNLQVQTPNPNGFVQGINPGANTQVPPQSVVILQCG